MMGEESKYFISKIVSTHLRAPQQLFVSKDKTVKSSARMTKSHPLSGIQIQNNVDQNFVWNKQKVSFRGAEKHDNGRRLQLVALIT